MALLEIPEKLIGYAFIALLAGRSLPSSLTKML
jgi:hypothetical protein